MEKTFLSPAETLQTIINTGYEKCRMAAFQTFCLAVLAGMFIALGGFAYTVASGVIGHPGLSKFAGAAVFPVGLIMVIICGAELFTGNNLLTTALLARKITYREMINNWMLVYAGNFIGSIFIVFLVMYSGLLNINSGGLGEQAVKIALNKVNLTFQEALIRAILCNILVVLAVWMAAAARDVTSKIWACWFPIMLFVLSGYEHSIANMYFIPLGILLKTGGMANNSLHLTLGSFIMKNLLPVTIGNIIGGAVIIGGGCWCIYKHKLSA